MAEEQGGSSKQQIDGQAPPTAKTPKGAEDEDALPPAPRSWFPIIVSILNVVVMAGGLAFFYYSKFIFSRPKITEDRERERLAEYYYDPIKKAVPGYFTLGPLTVNVGNRLGGDKSHFVALTLAIEVRDEAWVSILEETKEALIDRLIRLVAGKHYTDLVTAQGRYLLQNEIIDFSNEILKPRFSELKTDSMVSKVYYTAFLVQ